MAPKKSATSEPLHETKDAREECYEKIVAAAKEGLSRYYQEFPERIGDSRSAEAIAWSTRGVERVLRILDCYEVGRRSSGYTATE